MSGRLAYQIEQVCAESDCDQYVWSRGLCSRHLSRLMRSTSRAERGTTHRRTHSAQVGYSGAHGRCLGLWGSATNYCCAGCGDAAQDWAYDGTDPSQLIGPRRKGGRFVHYSAWPEFYMPLCRRCHGRRDSSKWRLTPAADSSDARKRCNCGRYTGSICSSCGEVNA